MGNATLMTLRNSGRPSGFGRLLTPFVSVAMRFAMTKDLNRLAQILEARPSA